MQFVKSDKHYVIRLEKGEPIISRVTEFCEENNITSGLFHGIGAALSAEIGFYNLADKEYSWKKINEPMEIVSLTGNISLVEDKPFLHIHIVLSNSDFECFGGHLKDATVGATCEIYLTDSLTKIERKMDEEIGLKLLNCSELQ